VSKALYEELKARDLLDYGCVIKGEVVRDILGIEYPEVGTKKDFDEVALAELGAVDYVRNILLGDGKYLASQQGDYRILLPSENKRQVDIYMNQADRKLRRALKLSRSMPQIDSQPRDNTTARLMMKRESLRRGDVAALSA
jgi:hypothetical protein